MIKLGDCLEGLRALPDNSVDSIVTDPPYGLKFMGKAWDYDVPPEEVWRECLRVLKPGGHLLCFAGTRTQHRMAVRIEDAGFEIRDMIAWVYSTGFPKSLDVAKAIDKVGGEAVPPEFAGWLRAERQRQGLTAKELCERGGFYKNVNHGGLVSNWEAGLGAPNAAQFNLLCDLLDLPLSRREEVEREVLGWRKVAPGVAFSSEGASHVAVTAPATDAARQWQGWGTALKPALETVTFASKPYTDEQEQDIILSNLIRLEARLWLMSSASAVEKSSTSSQSEYGVACAIAQWSAEEITSTRAALCDPMGTSLFELATTTSLSIVSSWRRTLEESWSDGSTSTTGTKSSTTTDWRTLKFSLSQITPESIIKACSLPGGFSANASTAESHFNASLSLLQSIRALSATERAMSQAQHGHRGAGVKPNLDPCIMARKPLDGTVATNVLAHGTGALNIDGCRVPTGDEVIHVPQSDPSKRAGIVGSDLGISGANTSDFQAAQRASVERTMTFGRWPANLIHDGSDEVLAGFPESSTTGKRSAASRAATVEGTAWLADNHQSTEYTDTGSAARFFKQVEVTDAEWLENLAPALIAGSTLSLSNLADAIAQSDAAISALPEGRQLNVLKAPSTSVTLSESKLIATSVITAIQSIASASLLAQQPERLSLSRSHVSVVAHQTPTGTMTITASLSSSAGCVESITFSITPNSLGAGEKDCEQSSARFMYCAKASKRDREEGLDGLAERKAGSLNMRTDSHSERNGMTTTPRRNTHPTVKPTDLMRYLCRLVTPPGGLVLDPYTGSGSTAKAAALEGFRFLGFEIDPGYHAIAERRWLAAIGELA